MTTELPAVIDRTEIIAREAAPMVPALFAASGARASMRCPTPPYCGTPCRSSESSPTCASAARQSAANTSSMSDQIRGVPLFPATRLAGLMAARRFRRCQVERLSSLGKHRLCRSRANDVGDLDRLLIAAHRLIYMEKAAQKPARG